MYECKTHLTCRTFVDANLYLTFNANLLFLDVAHIIYIPTENEKSTFTALNITFQK